MWKQIKGFSYFVSSSGEIKSSKGRIKKQSINKKGYAYVALWKNNKHKHCKVHRLVAQSFLPNPKKCSQINHKNGNKLDNQVNNLEWVTNQENRNHAIQNKLIVFGEKSHYAKLSEKDVLLIRKYSTLSTSVLAFIFDVSTSQIRRIKTNKSWRFTNASLGR